MTTTVMGRAVTAPALSPLRVNLMCVGHALMAGGLVALPAATGEGLDAPTAEVAASCSLVVVVLAVVPWPHVWERYVVAPGERWRR